MKKKLLALGVVAALAGGGLTACSNEDPLAQDSSSQGRIVVGSANFPESQIIGELYAQALENAGFEVQRQANIGARDVYLTALSKGDIDVVPEYTGNAAQFYQAGDGEADGKDLTPGASADEVYDALVTALPDGVAAGEKAAAESKDSYRVTPTLARQHELSTLDDLKKLTEDGTLTIAGNPELESRPYGPDGLESFYDVPKDKIKFQAISDSGGPLTVGALQDGTVDVADIYTTSPAMDKSGKEAKLVELKDPKRLILPQNVVPLLRDKTVDDKAREALSAVQEKLTTQALLEMNRRNTGEEKAEPATIAKDWLADQGITG